jgi:hypothetical protein
LPSPFSNTKKTDTTKAIAGDTMGAKMSAMHRANIGLCLLLAMAASVAAQTPQGNATFYFMRSDGLINIGAPDIKIDGQIVGELSGGTYFVVSRRAGPHTIEVQPGGLAGGFTSELSAVPGQTYFIAISPNAIGGPGAQLMADLIHGRAGTPMPGRQGFNASYIFYSFDAAQGRAEIVKLKKVGAH